MLRYLESLTIPARIWGLLLVLALALAGTNFQQLIERKADLTREKELKTRHLVESAFGVLGHFHRLHEQGQMPESAAKAAAIAAIKAMRYQETEYFWINDFATPFPRMVMHPTVPWLDGEVLDAPRFNCATSLRIGIDGAVEKTDGRKNLFLAFNEVANRGGHGFVTYDWPKPKAGGGTTEELFPKLSYVKKFEPWGWLIGSGIYIDDVDNAFHSEAREHLLAMVPPLVAAFLLLAALLRFSLAPVRRLAAAATDMAGGNFHVRVATAPGDPPEMSSAVTAFNGMAESIETLLHDLAEHKEQLEERVRQRTADLSTANTALTAEHAAQQALIKKLEDAQHQLLQSEKMASIGQLAAGVAHEINNPVGFVNSNLCTLHHYVQDLLTLLAAFERRQAELPAAAQAEIADLERQLEVDFLRQDIDNLLAESKEGLDRVKRIVQDLKDFSHVDTMDRQRANLERGLDSTLNVVWNEIKYKAKVVKEYAGIAEIDCVPAQLNQVFLNLLVNAAQAIDKDGLITLRTGESADQVWVEVADSGHGIQPEHVARIFDPFFTTKPVGKGTGLGLSLAYGIVQKHGGRIEVSSEPQRGTTFRVVLPKEFAGEGAAP